MSHFFKKILFNYNLKNAKRSFASRNRDIQFTLRKNSPVRTISRHHVAHSFVIIITNHCQKLYFWTKFVFAGSTSIRAIGTARTIILARLVFIRAGFFARNRFAHCSAVCVNSTTFSVAFVRRVLITIQCLR